MLKLRGGSKDGGMCGGQQGRRCGVRVQWGPTGLGTEGMGPTGSGARGAVGCSRDGDSSTVLGRGQVPTSPSLGTQRGSVMLGSPCQQLARGRGRALGEPPALLTLCHRAGSKDKPSTWPPGHPSSCLRRHGRCRVKIPQKRAGKELLAAWAGEEQRRWLTVGVGRQRGCGAGAVPGHGHGGPVPTPRDHRATLGSSRREVWVWARGGAQGAASSPRAPPGGCVPWVPIAPRVPILVWAPAELALPPGASWHAVGVPARRGSTAPFP